MHPRDRLLFAYHTINLIELVVSAPFRRVFYRWDFHVNFVDSRVWRNNFGCSASDADHRLRLVD